jgi:hypothetical protein
MKNFLFIAVILAIGIMCLPVSAIAKMSAMPQTTGHIGEGNFVTGFFGPLVFLVSAPSILLSPTPEGSSLVNSLFAQTWGKGSSSYRFGFIFGCIILISIPGAAGSISKNKSGG